jgi:hypothetical protein
MSRKCQIDSHTLWLLTLSYLALPVAIFAAGWLQLPYAAIAIISLAAGLWFRGKRTEEIPVAVPFWQLLLIAIGCVALCILAGVGGFGYQDGDYFKHNAIVADLFRRDWPVAYSIEHGGSAHPAALVYYLAYYLPPALVGKIAGWEALRYALVIWTACGLFITSLWCLRFSRGALWAPLAFLAFGGLDVFGMFLGIRAWSWMPELWFEHRQMEWWTGFSFGNYPSHSCHLFWAPQHALSAWLATAALFYRIRSRTLAGCLFLAALTPLWSPLVSLGLLPVGLAGILITKGKGTFSHSNLAALPLLGMSCLYFAARGMPEIPFTPIPFGWNNPAPLKLAVTFILEVLPWALLLFVSTKASPKASLAIILPAVIFLAILPLWRIGAYNDLMMRASLPAFSLLSFLILHKWIGASSRWKKTALVILIAGSGGLVFDVIRHIELGGGRANQTDFSSPDKVPILPATPDLLDLLGQYLGSPRAVFFDKLTRPLPAVGDPVNYDRKVPPPGAIESQDRTQKNLRHRFAQGERSMEFLRQYSTLSYYQGDLWEAILGLETMVKLYPDDPNARINLATLLAMSGIEAYRERALTELDAARRLSTDADGFDRITKDLRQSLTPDPKLPKTKK